MRENLHYSGHAITRMAQRCLSADEIEYIICYGQRHHAAGIIHCFLGKKNIPAADQKTDRFRRLEGATVLLDAQEGGAVITVYRNKSAWKKIRRKAKYNLKTTMARVN
jgi:hypothetical protein